LKPGTAAARPNHANHSRPIEPATLLSLADRVRRLLPSHRDPEAFHVEKSVIEHELRSLARGWPEGLDQARVNRR
jgi:hypothetical protein